MGARVSIRACRLFTYIPGDIITNYVHHFCVLRLSRTPPPIFFLVLTVNHLLDNFFENIDIPKSIDIVVFESFNFIRTCYGQ